MKQKSYRLLFVVALILVLSSIFVSNENNSVDIHIHDTYFVIGLGYFFGLLAIIFLFLWMIYLLTNKLLYSEALTRLHVMVSILALVFVVFIVFFGDNFSTPKPRRYYYYRAWRPFGTYTTFTKAMGITISLLFVGQFILIINLIAGLFKRLTNTT